MRYECNDTGTDPTTQWDVKGFPSQWPYDLEEKLEQLRINELNTDENIIFDTGEIVTIPSLCTQNI